MIIFDIILALSSLAMNYDITSRGALPSDNYTYGISYYLFIVVAVLILLVTIAMSILKKHPELFTEKDDKNKNVKLTNSKDTKNTSSENNKIVDSLKKYWYIIAIVIVVLIAIFAFVFTGKSKDNSTEKNNNTDEVDETDDSDNDTTSTFPGKTETDSKIEYTLVQTLKGNVVLIGKNKNDGVNDIEIEVEFYDKDNKFIGSASGDIDASVENNEFAIYLYSAPESYDHYKVFFDLEETDNKSYTNKLKVTSNNTGEKIVGQIENTTGEEIEYMDIAILFYKGDKVVGHDYTLESEIKAGRSANFEFGFPYDKNYDDVDFDTYKIFINDAYTYTW